MRDAGGGPGVVAGGRGGEVRSGGGIDLLIDGPDFAPRCPSSFGWREREGNTVCLFSP